MISSNAERINACLRRHPDWTDKRIRNALNIQIAEIRTIRAGAPAVAPGPEAAEDAPRPALGLAAVSMAEIRGKLDIAAAIRRELAKIRRGQLLPEDELCRLTSGRDRNRFRRAVENNPDLARTHRVKLRLDDSGDGKYYWGSEEDVAEATRLRDL
jgi:hypothetical protein